MDRNNTTPNAPDTLTREKLRTDPLPVDPGDDVKTKLEAALTPHPVTGYAPENSALGAGPLGGVSGGAAFLTGGAFVGGGTGITGDIASATDATSADGGDGHLVHSVQAALAASFAPSNGIPDGIPDGIHVSAAFGVIELAGEVISAEEKARAEQIAGSVGGVQVVENRLHVRRH